MLGIFTSIWRILVEMLLLVETHLNVEQNMWKHLWSAVQPSTQPWPWFSFVLAIFHVSPSTQLCSFWQRHLRKCLWIFPFFPCQPLGFLWHLLFMTSFFIRCHFENFLYPWQLADSHDFAIWGKKGKVLCTCGTWAAFGNTLLRK